MKKWILALLLFVCLCTGGCGTESVRTDDYEYLIGVSLTNVMEPWLNNLAQVIGSRAETEKKCESDFQGCGRKYGKADTGYRISYEMRN